MKIIPKAQAMQIKEQHPDARTEKYCSKKYAWEGSQKHYIGRKVAPLPGVVAVYVDRRQDKEGTYALIISVVVD
jgi:hypothetical protein